MPLNIVGLFSGIGGLELGLSRAGHTTTHLCEIDDGARAVLEKHFPDREFSIDIRRLATLSRHADMVVAGFPCQDLSQAGRVRGIDGLNSGLVQHVFRLIERSRTPWVLLENVPFMLKLDRGAAIRRITTRLEQLGYKWAYRLIDAQAFGVPQRRPRAFLLASLADDPRRVLLSEDSPKLKASFGLDEAAHGFYWTEGNRGIGWAENAIPALKGGSGVNIPSPPAILLTDGSVVVPTIEGAERLQGFPAGWTNPATKAGFAKRRWAYIGNAVHVRVAKWIGKRLLRPLPYDPGSDKPLDRRRPWPNAAWYDGNIHGTSSVSFWPRKTTPHDLKYFIRDRYEPLSGRAAAGFLARLDDSKLRVVPGFKEALMKHIERSGALPLFRTMKADRLARRKLSTPSRGHLSEAA